jgi:hypothetical protein
MAYPLAATPYPPASVQPVPAYTGTFIPEIWSGKLIEKFYATTVLAAISNTQYEGEIKNQGDTVKIRQRPTVSIKDYTAGLTLEFERPSANILTLSIDKGKYFNTILDDVHDIQSDFNLMNLWSEDAAEQMKIGIDTETLLFLLGKADVKNRGTTAGFLSSSINLGATGSALTVVARAPAAGQIEVVDLIVRLGQTLDEQNIPETGRWIVVPSWFASKIKMSELRDASLTGDSTSIVRNGRLGMIDRFTIYVSNLLPRGPITGPPALGATEWVIFAGISNALTFATQMTRMETLRSESTFGTIMRGLQVYGRGIIDDNSLVEAVVIPGP